MRPRRREYSPKQVEERVWKPVVDAISVVQSDRQEGKPTRWWTKKMLHDVPRRHALNSGTVRVTEGTSAGARLLVIRKHYVVDNTIPFSPLLTDTASAPSDTMFTKRRMVVLMKASMRMFILLQKNQWANGKRKTGFMIIFSQK